MKTASATILFLLSVLVPAASGLAASVPPGNGAATQYTETLPGAGGEEAAHGAGGHESGGGNSGVPAGTAAELAELGQEGEVTLRLADATAPRHDGQGGGGRKEDGAASGSGDSGSLSARAEGGGSSGLDQVLGGAVGTSGGGLGLLQPLILLAVFLAAGAYAFRRHGRGLT
jgi:hypothetical protein